MMSMKNMRMIIIIAILVLIGCGFAIVWATFINTQTGEVEGINYDKDSFIFVVESTTQIANSGMVVQGKVERGVLNVNDTVRILGVKNKVIESKITKLELNKKNYTTAKAGEQLGLVLEGVTNPDNIVKGQVITSNPDVKASKNFDVKIQVLTKEEKGAGKAINSKDEVKAYINSLYAKGTIDILDGLNTVEAGQTANANIKLNTLMAIYPGEEITIFSDKTEKIAKCKVVNIY